MAINTQKVKAEHTDRRVPKIGLSIDEAAWALGVGRDTIDRMLSEGVLCYTLIRSKPVIDPDDLRTIVKTGKVVRNRSETPLGRLGAAR